MAKKITKHARRRLRERSNIRKDYGSLIVVVKKKGKTKHDYCGEFHNYLCSKGANIKVYNETIYIFSKGKKKLITTYPVPSNFLPTSKYEAKTKEEVVS